MDAVCSARRARLAGSGIDEGAVAGAWVQHARRRSEQAERQARLELGIYGVGYAGKCEGKPAALAGSGWRAGLEAGFAAAIPFGRDFEFRNGAHGAFAGGCFGYEERGTAAGGADCGLRADFIGGPAESRGGSSACGMARDAGTYCGEDNRADADGVRVEGGGFAGGDRAGDWRMLL